MCQYLKVPRLIYVLKWYIIHCLTLNWLGGQIDTTSCGFSKHASSKERVTPWFFVTFNIILSHIFPENFNEIPQVAQKLCRYFPFAKSNLRENLFTQLTHFLIFLVCFYRKITWHFRKVKKKVKTERVSNWTDAQSSCLKLASFNVMLVYSVKGSTCFFIRRVADGCGSGELT